ncbi:beta-hexosaminidase 3-like isoform X1 [Salvia hispanica]|uniref:beta-hexosaminidase 3-like isoform X1 n=1 Tax=Salvia hispanica TaxID=49212 RepID=UPI0020095D90|nr:beta-hexosaminidase 3-like isoform X1 [Salvia hispanica]XP_047968686.1 beta-hexosaminidase 3-like isoform X1 [Salvia hispanica]
MLRMGRTRLKIEYIWYLVCFLAIPCDADDKNEINIWPMPVSVSFGSGNLHLSNDFELITKGSKFADASGILKEAFFRTIDIVRSSHVVELDTSKINPSFVLKGIHVIISSPSDELQYGIDESYKLNIPAHGKPVYAYIEAKTVYGALHGLQTFSQICSYSISSRGILVHQVPWIIADQPRFSYRGLLIDTARHYQPLQMIKKIIDAMAYTKLNVLHWHIVDKQSFPLEIPSYPKLWDGSFTIFERYTVADAAEIVSYAKKRGINVLAEIDVPGHAESWGVGYPSLRPSENCTGPLDVSNDFTFKLIDGILSDFSKIFKFKFIHLGGDEVDTSCWIITPHVKSWLQKQGIDDSDAYQYFVLRVQKLALSHGYEIINWEEAFNDFGSKLNPQTVVHNWIGGGVAEKIVKTGLRCIVSNQDKWYLDHYIRWQDFYSNEPLENITNHELHSRVLGGEVCMWGELIDAGDIEQMVWPRAAAAAERMWTSYDKLAKDPSDVRGRLSHFRCLLNQRGVASSPLEGLGKTRPYGPGSCYMK